MQKKAIKTLRVSKLNLWLQNYLNSENPLTFFNATESAKAAGYRAKSEESFRSIGHQNFMKLHNLIGDYVEEVGLDVTTLKIKLLELLEAKKTIFIKLKGEIDKQSLPSNVQIIASAVSTKTSPSGMFEEIENILGVTVEDKEAQRKALDMALRISGLYAPEKREHAGKDGGPIQLGDRMNEALKSLLRNVAGNSQKTNTKYH